MAYSQDPTFSQYYNNPLYFNPGFTGIRPGLNCYINSRSQWLKIPSQFNTKTIAADLNNDCRNFGIGLIILDDNEGEGKLRTTSFGASVAYKMYLGKNGRILIQPGLQAGIVKKKIDWDRLEFSDQINPYNSLVGYTHNIPPVSDKVNYPDLSVGFVSLIESRKKSKFKNIWLFGASVSHIHQPDQAFYKIESKLPTKYNIQTSLFISLDRLKNLKKLNRYIEPFFQLEKQKVFREFVLGGKTQLSIDQKVNRDFIFWTIGYRNQKWFNVFNNYDAIIFETGFRTKINDNEINIGLSWDITISKLSGSTNGTPELSIKFGFPKANPFCRTSSMNDNNKKVICPHF